MREIKLRAWHGQRKEMFDPMPIIDFKLMEINGHIIMQFTGLKDKNGKDIYEGDIVQLYFYDSYKKYTYQYEKSQVWKDGKHHDAIKEVKFVMGSFVIWSDLIKDYRCFANLARPGEKLEVVGNIYENPELLK